MPSKPIPDLHYHHHHHNHRPHHHSHPQQHQGGAPSVPALLAQLPRALAAEQARRWGNAFDVPANGRPGH